MCHLLQNGPGLTKRSVNVALLWLGWTPFSLLVRTWGPVWALHIKINWAWQVQQQLRSTCICTSSGSPSRADFFRAMSAHKEDAFSWTWNNVKARGSAQFYMLKTTQICFYFYHGAVHSHMIHYEMCVSLYREITTSHYNCKDMAVWSLVGRASCLLNWNDSSWFLGSQLKSQARFNHNHLRPPNG